jgi:nucleoside-diphosphate-sugar epimerase
MRVALTGACGFVGSATRGALVRAGVDVVAHSGPEQFDICNTEALAAFMQGCELIVHVAGPPSVAASFEQPVEFARAHVLGTASVLHAMRCADVRGLVYVSSAEVYGQPRGEIVSEDQPPAPRSPYGAAKAAAEIAVTAASAYQGANGYIIRPFSIYGPNMPAGSLISRILRQAEIGDEIAVNDLAPVRDYCFVDDVAELIAAAVLSPRRGIVALNAGSGKGYSVEEVVDAAARALNRRLTVVERGDKRPAGVEIRRLVADVRAAQRELGWRARHELVAGLRATVGAAAAAR